MRNEIQIRIECLRPEQLIRRALETGIVFTGIVRTGSRTITVSLPSRDADTLTALCKRYSIRAKVIRVKGPAYVLGLVRKRATLIAGIAVCIILCYFILSRVWLIDITLAGDRPQGDGRNAILSTLEEMDVRPGISSDTDTTLLSGMLASELQGFSYVSAGIQGIRLQIEAVPETREPDLYDLGYARDIYAACSGIVESINVYSGEACVKPGDIIRRGQLLIRGEEQAAAESTRSISALGKVIVRTWYEGSSSGSLSETRMVPTGRSSVDKRLEFMNFMLPLAQGESFVHSETRIRHLPVVGLFLPLEILVRENHEMHKTTVSANLESLSDRLCALAMADAASNLALNGPDEFEISRSWIRYDDSEEGVLKAHAVYEIYTDAAITMEALIQGG